MDRTLPWTTSDRKRSKHYDVSGANFCKYYQRPTKTHYKPDNSIKNTEEVNSSSLCHDSKNDVQYFQENGTQTDYRESQSQTDPWDPPFIVNKVFKEPEVLGLKDFYYGNGLPAGRLEVEYISKSKKLKDLNIESTSDENDKHLKKTKQVIQDQAKNNWSYRLAVLNQEQQEKLAKMQANTIEDLKRKFMKKENVLKKMWENKKVEMSKTHLQLEHKLQKELHVLERSFSSHSNDYQRRRTSLKTKTTQDVTGGIDYMLKNYYLSSPSGIPIVKKWFEDDSDSLTCNILRKTSGKIERDSFYDKELSISDKGKILAGKKKVIHPPVIEDEDFEEEESTGPTPKPEVLLEPPVFEKKKVNLVTVWQQALRGLACQKQMLDLIERHREGLTTILEPLYPGIADS